MGEAEAGCGLMRATWSMNAGLTVVGQHNAGQPRRWTIKAWASIESGQRENVTVRVSAPCTLRDLIPLINAELEKFEKETGCPTVDAGFVAMAR